MNFFGIHWPSVCIGFCHIQMLLHCVRTEYNKRKHKTRFTHSVHSEAEAKWRENTTISVTIFLLDTLVSQTFKQFARMEITRANESQWLTSTAKIAMSLRSHFKGIKSCDNSTERMQFALRMNLNNCVCFLFFFVHSHLLNDNQTDGPKSTNHCRVRIKRKEHKRKTFNLWKLCDSCFGRKPLKLTRTTLESTSLNDETRKSTFTSGPNDETPLENEQLFLLFDYYGENFKRNYDIKTIKIITSH